MELILFRKELGMEVVVTVGYLLRGFG